MNQQLSLIPPDISNGTWHVFSGDTNEDEAARIYQARHGTPPQHIVDRPGRAPQLWLGPIQETH